MCLPDLVDVLSCTCLVSVFEQLLLDIVQLVRTIQQSVQQVPKVEQTASAVLCWSETFSAILCSAACLERLLAATLQLPESKCRLSQQYPWCPAILGGSTFHIGLLLMHAEMHHVPCRFQLVATGYQRSAQQAGLGTFCLTIEQLEECRYMSWIRVIGEVAPVLGAGCCN